MHVARTNAILYVQLYMTWNMNFFFVKRQICCVQEPPARYVPYCRGAARKRSHRSEKWRQFAFVSSLICRIFFLIGKKMACMCLETTLQMKGRWESNINGWFPLICSQKWNCAASQKIIKMFGLQIRTLIYLWEIYIFPGLVCLFRCSQICGPILGI